MKTLAVLLLVSLIISSGLTFLLFAPEPPQIDPILEEYQETFALFGKNAGEMYQLHGADGLSFLQEYQAEGLGILKHYSDGFQLLQPYMELDSIFQLFRYGQRPTFGMGGKYVWQPPRFKRIMSVISNSFRVTSRYKENSEMS